MPRATTTETAGTDVFTVRRYCVKCHAVSLLRRPEKRCPVCGEHLELTKAAQGHWGSPFYRPEITGEPPVKIEQPRPPGPEPGEDRKTLDAAYAEAVSKPLTPEELKGFGEMKKNADRIRPYASIGIVERRGKRGPKVEIGLKGTF